MDDEDFEKPELIKEIGVLEGQKVSKGPRLLPPIEDSEE